MPTKSLHARIDKFGVGVGKHYSNSGYLELNSVMVLLLCSSSWGCAAKIYMTTPFHAGTFLTIAGVDTGFRKGGVQGN